MLAASLFAIRYAPFAPQLIVRLASGLSSENAGIAMSKRSPASVTML